MIASFGKRLMRPKAWLGVILVLGVAALARADDSMPAELQRCASVVEAADRLACYDEFAGRAAPAVVAIDTPQSVAEPPAQPPPVAAEPQRPAPAAVPAPETAAAKTLDDIDSETDPNAITNEKDALLVRARVTRCEKDARKKYYFVFDNGQVWKQVSDKRLRYRECEFDVTITKDFFGYKMQVDGEKGRIRIDRIR